MNEGDLKDGFDVKLSFEIVVEVDFSILKR